MSGRLILVDASPSQRLVLKSRLAAAMYDVVALAAADQALAQARASRPDAVVVDLEVPGATDFLRDLRADPQLAAVPAVALCAPGRSADRHAAFAAGADDVLPRPGDEGVLLARLRNLTRRHGVLSVLEAPGTGAGLTELGFAEAQSAFDPPGAVALVVARPDTAVRLRMDLSPLLRDRLVVMGRSDVLAAPAEGEGAADLYVIEADLGGAGGGARLMCELLAHNGTRHAALCLLRRAPAEAAEDALAFDLGAGDVIAEGTPPEEMALRLRALLRRKRTADGLRARLKDGLRLAVTDPLTGLHNRRYAEAQLTAIAENARHTERPFAVMVLDLDRFKAVNDRHGHAAGDAVLVEVARRLAANLRAGDLLARVGGEEFLIALPGAGPAEAQRAAERLCSTMSDRPVALPGGGSLAITVSIGLAFGNEVTSTDETVPGIIDRADQALMRSKTAGRNQVTVSRLVA